MSINFKNLLSNSQKEKISGIFPIITVNSNSNYNNTIINGNILSYNNSNLIILNNCIFNKYQDLNIDIKFKNYIFNNSIVKIQSNIYNVNNSHILQNNSYINIGSIKYNKQLSACYGGAIDINNYISNYNFVWSSNLYYDFQEYTIKWQEYNNNTIFVNNNNELDISIDKNNEFTDRYNISKNFFYQNNLIYGFFKTVKFNLNNKENRIINGFSILNNKNNIELNSLDNTSCTGQIKINDIFNITINKLNFTKLNAQNSKIIINNNDIITSLFGQNIYLELNKQIFNYQNLKNSYIKINQPKLSYPKKIENTTDYLPGYSMVENTSGILLSSFDIDINNINADISIKDYIITNISEDNLSDYDLIQIYKYIDENIEYKLQLSNIYNYFKNTSDTLLNGSYRFKIYKHQNLSTLFQYNTYPQFGNTVQSKDTITVTNRNNNYKYGLQSHSHKLYSKINSNYSKGTLFPIQSINNHVRLSNSFKNKLLKESTGCSYYQPSASFLNMYIPQRTIIPIGSIINFYQVKVQDPDDNTNYKWKPEIPNGYYRLSNIMITPTIDSDNSSLNTFNGELAKIHPTQSNTILINLYSSHTKSSILQLSNDATEDFNSNIRLIKLIKYAEKGDNR